MRKKIFLILLLLLFIFGNKDKLELSRTTVLINANSYLEGQNDLNVTSSKYLLKDSFIKHVQPKTSEKDFVSSFTTSNATLGVNCGGVSFSYIGTGCTLMVQDLSMKTVDYDIVVTGDVTGDGTTTVTDVVKIASHALEKGNLEDKIYLEAADLDQDTTISVNDSNSLAYYSILDKDIPIGDDKSTGNTIELVSKMLVLSKGASQKLLTKNQPEGAILEWKSSNENVVVVDSTGLVTGVGSGEATITVKASSENAAMVQVDVVVVVPPTGIQLDISDSFSLNVGQIKNLTATVSPNDTTNNHVVWESSDSKIATVSDNGVVKGISVGTATITARTANGHIAKTEVKVVQPVTGIVLSRSTINSLFGVDQVTYNLSATITPSNATDLSIVWNSSNPTVASVNATGQVNILSVGTTVITATASNGLKAGCTVVVAKPTLKLSASGMTLKDEDSNKLSVVISPSNIDPTVSWSSSNTSVVTVDNSGNLKAKSSGTAIITATSTRYAGISASATITVRPIKVLFVGNSKTYYPDGESGGKGIPLRLKNIAASGGYELDYTMAVKGGKTLIDVYGLKETLISGSVYDYVVLQEQNAAYINSSIATYNEGVTTIAEAVKAKNPNVQIYLRKVWALTTSTTSQINRGYNNTLQLASVLKNTYGISSNVINDGPAFYEIYNNSSYSDVVTLFSDDRHQTAAGAYLSGLCIYSTMFDKDPTSVTYTANLDSSVVTLLKKVAKNHCS